jgi:hypothetical protein
MMIQWLRQADEIVRAESFVEPHVSTSDAILMAENLKRHERNEFVKYMDILAFKIHSGEIITTMDTLREIERIKNICRQ